MDEPRQAMWSGRVAFIMATTGATIGLGNLWRFPYMASEYGGILFVVIYLVCITFIGLPIIMAEVMIGRMGRQSPINGIRVLAEKNGRSRHWQLIGWMAIVAGVLILSFYSVIAGWSMAYFFRITSGSFDGITTDGASAVFGFLIGDPEKLLAWHTLFLIVTYFIVSHGVRRGLEVAVKIMMPLLLVMLLLMLGYAINTGYFSSGVGHMLFPDTERLSTVKGLGLVILAALGQAFFTLSLGAGAILIYGSYLSSSVSITNTSISIVLLDTLFAVIGGMIIYPLLLANGLETVDFNNGLSGQYGPGLIFQSLPMAFGQLQWGNFFGGIFFLIIIVAALTSSIALLEPLVAYLQERYSMSRRMAATIGVGLAWLLGLGTIFSFNIWSNFHLIESIEIFEYKTIYHLFDLLASNILLPLGGLLLAIFAGWALQWKNTEDELSMGQEYCGYALWRFCVRYVSPALLAIVLVYSLLKATGYLEIVP